MHQQHKTIILQNRLPPYHKTRVEWTKIYLDSVCDKLRDIYVYMMCKAKYFHNHMRHHICYDSDVLSKKGKKS